MKDMLIPTKYNIFEFSDCSVIGKTCPINDNLSRNRPKGRNLSFSVSGTDSPKSGIVFFSYVSGFKLFQSGKRIFGSLNKKFQVEPKVKQSLKLFFAPRPES